MCVYRVRVKRLKAYDEEKEKKGKEHCYIDIIMMLFLRRVLSIQVAIFCYGSLKRYYFLFL